MAAHYGGWHFAWPLSAYSVSLRACHAFLVVGMLVLLRHRHACQAWHCSPPMGCWCASAASTIDANGVTGMTPKETPGISGSGSDRIPVEGMRIIRTIAGKKALDRIETRRRWSGINPTFMGHQVILPPLLFCTSS